MARSPSINPKTGQTSLQVVPVAQAAGIEVTDDSLLVERLGAEIIAVEGSARNIKITRSEDLVLAEAILSL